MRIVRRTAGTASSLRTGRKDVPWGRRTAIIWLSHRAKYRPARHVPMVRASVSACGKPWGRKECRKMPDKETVIQTIKNQRKEVVVVDRSRSVPKCRRCMYYHPEFKYRSCLYSACPFGKDEKDIFRVKPPKGAKKRIRSYANDGRGPKIGGGRMGE